MIVDLQSKEIQFLTIFFIQHGLSIEKNNFLTIFLERCILEFL